MVFCEGDKMVTKFDEKMSEMGKILNESIKNEEILQLVLPFGYTKERLLILSAEHDEIYEFDGKQKKETGIQLESAKKLAYLSLLFEKSYNDFVIVSRTVFKDKPSAYLALGLKGERKKSFSGLTNQGKLYYSTALTDREILNLFIANGIKEEDLKEGKKHLDDLLEEHNFHDKEMEDKKVLTKARDEKYDNLVEKVSEYKTFAKFALRNRQDLLNILGL